MEFIVDYIKIYDYKKMIFPLTLLILYIIGFVYLNEKIDKKEYACKENIVFEDNKEILEESKEEIKEYIYVDVKGAVKNPGVYKLEKKSRVIDAINISGGLIKTSNTSYINLSKILNDEETIKIYTNDEIKEAQKEEIIQVTQPCICEEKIEENKININTSTQEELQTLTGIGESKAKSIIEYRTNNGNFTKIEDIMNVNGISETLFEKIKEFITI